MSETEHPLPDGATLGLAGDLVEFRLYLPSPETQSRTATLGGRDQELRVDEASRQVWVGGVLVSPPLAPKAFAVLSVLFARRGEVVTKDDLALAAWPEREGIIGNQEIEQCVRRIRRRIEADPYEPVRLMTRKGIGYQLL